MRQDIKPRPTQPLKLGRSLLAIAASNHVETFLGLVTSAIAARTLGATDYGTYAWILTWVTLGQSLSNSGITTALQRYIAQTPNSERTTQAPHLAAYLRKIQIGQLSLVAFLGALTLAATLPSSFRNNLPELVAIILAGVIFRSLYIFHASACKGAGAFTAAALITILGSLINLGTTTIAAISHANLYGFLIAYLTTSIAFSLIASLISLPVFKRPHPSTPLAPEISARIRTTLLYLTPSALISQASGSQLDLLLLGSLAPQQDAGYFRIGLTLASGIVAAASGALATITLPYISSAVKEGGRSGGIAYERLTRYFTLLAAPVIAITITLAHILVSKIYGASFHHAAIALSILIIPIFIAELNSPAQAVLVSTGSQKQILMFSIGMLAFKLSIGAYLTHAFGLNGAIAAFTIATVGISWIKSFMARRILGTPHSKRIQITSAITAGILALPVYLTTLYTTNLLAISAAVLLFFSLYIILILHFRALSAPELLKIRFASRNGPRITRVIVLFALKTARPKR